MKNIVYLTLALTLTTGLVRAADPVPAASPAAEKSAAPAKASKPGPFKGTASAVDATAGTFTITNKDKTKVKTYTLAGTAKVTKEGKDATLAEMKVGDPVRGMALKVATDKYEVSTLKFGPKTAEELAADKVKKDKKASTKKEGAATE